MKTRIGLLYLIVALLLGWTLIAVGQELPPAIRILLVDETKTFTSTMKVAGTIGALRQMGLFDVSVRLADVETDFEDPLFGAAPEQDQDPFDLILILARGLDTKTNISIWRTSSSAKVASVKAEAKKVTDPIIEAILKARISLLSAVPGVRWAEGCFGTRLLTADVIRKSLKFGYFGRLLKQAGSSFGVDVKLDSLAQYALIHTIVTKL